MHLTELLHKTFEDKLPQVHKIRLKSLMTACEAAGNDNLNQYSKAPVFHNHEHWRSTEGSL